MSILRKVKSICDSVAYWIQESYCCIGQKVAERIEEASDALAEKRHRAQHRAEKGASEHPATAPVIDVTGYRVMNGYNHTQ
jgi:hypothetical protein